MKLTALTAALSLVASAFLVSACDRGPDDKRAADRSQSQSSSAGGTASPSQSQSSKPMGSPNRPQSKP